MSEPNVIPESELPSGAQLLRSTLLAMASAALILVFVVLPREYGISPLEIGQLFGIGRTAGH